MGALLFLLGFFTLMVLAARVLGYLMAKGKANGGGKKRKQHKISVSSSSSLPVYDEDDSTDVPFRRGGERLRGFKVKSSSTTGLRVGMGLVPVVGMPARAGSSLTVDGETGIIYIYGGEGQVQVRGQFLGGLDGDSMVCSSMTLWGSDTCLTLPSCPCFARE